MISRAMIWRCCLEVRWACSSSCLLFESCLSLMHKHHGTVQLGTAEQVTLAIAVLLGHCGTSHWCLEREDCPVDALRCASCCPRGNKSKKQRTAGEHRLRRMQDQGLKHRGWRCLSEGDEILRTEDKRESRKAWWWVFHTPLMRTSCALPAAAPAPQVEGVWGEALEI